MSRDPVATLFSDFYALRLIIQNEMGRAAAASSDFAGYLRARHAEVHDDATRVETDEETRLHLDAAIDRFFAPMLEGPALPKGKTA